MYTIVYRQVYCTFMKVYGGTCTTVVLIYNHSTVVQLCITSIIYKSAVTIKFSGNLDFGSETVTSTSFEYPYDSFYCNSAYNHGGRFLKKVLIFEKKGGCWFFPRVCMVGCMGRISHTNLKIRMVISRIATSKNHIELLVPGQIWDRIRDPGQILV